MLQIETEDNELYFLWEGEIIKKVPKRLFQKHVKTLSFENKKDAVYGLEKLEAQIAKKSALFLLHIRPYFSGALKAVLMRKGFSETVSDQTIAYLKKLSYLRDKDLVDTFIEQEIRKGNGPYLILQKLKGKKIGTAEANKRISEIYPLERQLKALQMLEKKSGKQGAKLLSYLVRRGFSLEVIKKLAPSNSYL